MPFIKVIIKIIYSYIILYKKKFLLKIYILNYIAILVKTVKSISFVLRPSIE